MELEQMSFNEALRYLANKYHIEIKEHEISNEERQQESERESMWAVNDFALRHFEENLAYEHFYCKYLALYHDRQTA